VYRPSLALLTDLYQLTMAYGYWKSGLDDREAVFHLSFRKHPFDGGFAVACGLSSALDWIESLRFDDEDLAYLGGLRGADGEPLFDAAWFERLRGLRLRLDVDAMPEGTVAFAHEPLVRVRGPIVDCQLLETLLLNEVNFQTLIATKAARVCLAAEGDPVIEFGLRRAHGIDGGLSASRAAFVGGCSSTSNVLAGRLFGIPVGGTHAHSWVMLLGDEPAAFRAYAGALPNNVVFLVDTYDTIAGVKHAITVGRELRAAGHELLGVRLDSGDLAWLSRESRRLLDEAGFPGARIYASNELDESVIQSLKQQGARIDVWGVGTQLVTGGGCSALGGVYKLAAARRPGESWVHRIKLSDQTAKVSTPGVLGVRRYRDAGGYLADAIHDELLGDDGSGGGPITVVHPTDPTRKKVVPAGTDFEELLVPVMRDGRRLAPDAPLDEARTRAREQLARFHPGVTRFLNPHAYPAGLESRLHDLRNQLVLEARGAAGRAA
jgi:nicotinate phosphoribosyltransferase